MDFKEEKELNEQCGEQEAPQSQEQDTAPKENVDLGKEPALNALPPNDKDLTEAFEKKHYITLTILLMALSILVTFIITYVSMSVSHQNDLDAIEQGYFERLDALGDFRPIAELYQSIPEEKRNIELFKKLAYIDFYYRSKYVGEIDEEQLINMVAAGYVLGTEDLFGGYYTADDFKIVMGEVDGNSVGIGIYATADMETGNIRVSYVMKDGPANKAGLLPGDLITHVDGKNVIELGYYSAIDLVKGDEGTQVKLTVKRGEQTFEKTLTRAKVNVETVIYEKHDTEKDVGIIRIIEFNNATTEQFISAVKKAIEKDGCKKLVFDLRGNPGGTLTSVVDILDFMLPSGPIITQRYADDFKYTFTSDDVGEEFEALYGKDIKMAVLVNGSTASAAELFTCALKDYEKATIVGEKTFGKGCGQSVLSLYDDSGIAITTFMYDPPKSENYNGVGIEPDVWQELSEEASKKNIFELKLSEDDQLKAALEALK